MTVKTKSTNVYLVATVKKLKKLASEKNANIWKTVAEFLERPKRKRIAVNVSKINRYTKEGETVIVPGKVLGTGEIDHKVNVAAFSFSSTAIEKIKKAGGTVMSIDELININPKGSNIRIII